MRRAIIGYQNRIDEAILSGGSWQAPLTNIQNRELQVKARSTDLLPASTLIDIDLGAYRVTSMIGVAAHNLSSDATYRVTAGTAAGLSDLYDSGAIEAWPAVYATDELEWEDDNFWDGRISEEERIGYNACLTLQMPTVGAQFLRLEIFDSANPSGYVELGRIFIGRKFEPERGFEVGASIGYVDESEVERSLQGVEYFREIQMHRVANLTAPVMNKNEAFSAVFEMQRKTGITKEVMIIGDPDDAAEQLRQSFIGRLQQVSPIVHTAYGLHSVGFEIKELI